MPKKLLIFVAIAALLLTPVLANADDLFPPVWRGTDRTQTAVWDDWTGYEWVNNPSHYIFPDKDMWQSNPPLSIEPYFFGLAVDYINDGLIYFKTTDLAEAPKLILAVSDYDQLNPAKWIRLQMTYGYNRVPQITATLPPYDSLTSVHPETIIL
jgi:hypothetical protein